MQRAKLTITDLAGQVLCQGSLDLGGNLMIGRGRSVGMQIKGELISREHAHVEFDIDGVFVSDVSRNGSFLHGERLDPCVRTQLPPGAKVQLGKDRLLSCVLVGEASEMSPEELPQALRPLTGQYTFLGEVGRSARRRVYMARHKHLRRTVSVEVPADRLAKGSPEAERFIREAKLYGRLDSPYLLKMYDFLLSEFRPVRIMERPTGLTAKERLAQGPLTIIEVLKIGADLGQALEVMESVGVVHRDIHPDGVILTHEGIAKLGSFGIAKVDDGVSITKTGVVLGRLGHTAPEQLEDARQADTRSDIYALGATLYHLLAGKPPLTPQDVARDQWDPASLMKRRDDCPPALAEFVMQLLAPRPKDRPQTAAEVRAALIALRDTHVSGPPSGAYGRADPALLETLCDEDDLV